MRYKITPKAVLIPTISLFLICIFVTAALALTNSVTADKIAANEEQSKQESMKTVCPDAADFEEVIPDILYAGKDSSGNTVGYAIATATQGYGGQVKVMTGIADDKIIAVDVFYNDEETPGLGKNTSNESFRDQYKGLSINEDIVVSKDAGSGNAQTVDAVTSATISSRAVTKAVNAAVEIYNENVSGASASSTGGVDDSSVTAADGDGNGYTSVADKHSKESAENAKEGE
ncbi:MAG: RnfABCDGE type electron transport complex subunit G [Ruminococcus sp.]|nr:RnfABCDGE type electron transport complex subunit G [Ruminococcus sp.]